MSSEGPSSGAKARENAGPGLLLVLSAPSGAGKTTLAHRFRAAHPDAVFSDLGDDPRAARRGAGRRRLPLRHRGTVRGARRAGRLCGVGRGARAALRHAARAPSTACCARGASPSSTSTCRAASRSRRPGRGTPRPCSCSADGPAELERRLRGRSTDSEAEIRRGSTRRVRRSRVGSRRYDYVVLNDELEAAHARARRDRAPRARAAGGPADPRRAPPPRVAGAATRTSATGRGPASLDPGRARRRSASQPHGFPPL